MVVLDADVLVPILSCDLLLCAFDHDLYQPVVTPAILSDLERTLREDFAHLNQEALARRGAQVAQVAQVAQTLALHTHPDAPVTGEVAGVNTKDRHVATVAVATKADFVASNDRRLRRQINQLNFRTRALTGDELMIGLHTSQPDAVRALIDAMVAKRVLRPVSRAELLGQLTGLFPAFVAAVRPDG